MEDSAIIKVWGIIAITVVLVAGVIGASTSYHARVFVKGGYCEQQKQGTTTTMWAKCGGAK